MGVITNGGAEFIANRIFTDPASIADTVAVGDGTSSPSKTDTGLDNELYSGDTSESIISITDTGTDGVYDVTITVSGGTEVPAGSSLTEVGLFTADGTLVFRDVVAEALVESGDRVTRTIEFIVAP